MKPMDVGGEVIGHCQTSKQAKSSKLGGGRQSRPDGCRCISRTTPQRIDPWDHFAWAHTWNSMGWSSTLRLAAGAEPFRSGPSQKTAEANFVTGMSDPELDKLDRTSLKFNTTWLSTRSINTCPSNGLEEDVLANSTTSSSPRIRE
jgi:hypothetical protein